MLVEGEYGEILRYSQPGSGEPLDPFWSIDSDDEEAVLEWIRKALEHTEMDTLIRTERQLINRMSTRAVAYEHQDEYGFFQVENKLVDTTKVVVPDQARYVKQVVAKLYKYRADTMPTPTTNEHADKQGAKIVKRALMSIKQQFDFDALDKKILTRLPTDGEAYLFCEWNPNGGCYTERWKNARKKYGKKKTKIGEWTYDPKEPEYIGELEFHTPQPWEIRIDPLASAPHLAGWVMRIEFKHKKEVHACWPKSEDESQAAGAQAFDVPYINPYSGTEKHHEEIYPIVHLWVRGSRKLPFGKHVIAVGHKVLELGDNPYSEIEDLQDNPWGDLPLENLTDIEVDGDIHGFPSLNLIRTFTNMRCQLMTNANRNLLLFGSPKFLVHRNSEFDIEAMEKGEVIIHWSGMEAPKLENFGVMPKEMISMFELTGEQIDKSGHFHPISQGTPPNNISAGTAMRLLQQIEDDSIGPEIKQMNNFIRHRDLRIKSLMGHFYKKEDGRFIRIVGRDNEDLVEPMNIEALTKKYNMKLELVSQDANSAAFRQQNIVDLLQYGSPDLLSREQILDALELNRPEKITDPAQAAIASAERNIELFVSGKDPRWPKEGENYLTRWKVYMAFYQRSSFDELPEERQELFRDLVKVLEYLMDEQALKNPAYQQVLLSQPQWPAFYAPSPRPMPPPPQETSQEVPELDVTGLQEPPMDMTNAQITGVPA